MLLKDGLLEGGPDHHVLGKDGLLTGDPDY
jgi:hypothetical protein